MSDFIRYELEDGSQVVFESAESDLVQLHGGAPDAVPGGELRAKLESVAAAADEISQSLRRRLTPDEVEIAFGIKVAGEVNWWFFAKSQADATINVTLTWKPEPG